MGFTSPIVRTTLLLANEQRDWRIYETFAQTLIKRARLLYRDDDSLLDGLHGKVYALDSTTIDLCLSVFTWAHFRETKGAVKAHTLLDLRDNLPTFIHITDGTVHDVNVLDVLPVEPDACYIMDRGYVDFGVPMLKNMYFQRMRTYRSQGFEIRQELLAGTRNAVPEEQMSIFA